MGEGELPRGVLSEDEAYDLLCDWHALQERMRELSGDGGQTQA